MFGLGVAFFATGPGLGLINVYLNDTRISYILLFLDKMYWLVCTARQVFPNDVRAFASRVYGLNQDPGV